MKPIFFHSALDDAGLSASVIRVYCHLARRDGGNGAWPSIEAIAKTCRLNAKTVRPALQKLETLGWIRRQKRDGFTDMFFVNAASEWATPLPNQYPSSALEGVTNEPVPSSQNNPPPSSQNRGDEGNPVKVIQKETPKEAKRSVSSGFAFPSVLNTEAFAKAWADWLAYRKERRSPLLRPIAAKAQLEQLAKRGQEEAIRSIRYSIAQNYQGLFLPREDKGKPFKTVAEQEAPRFSDDCLTFLCSENPARFNMLLQKWPSLFRQAERLNLKAV